MPFGYSLVSHDETARRLREHEARNNAVVSGLIARINMVLLLDRNAAYNLSKIFEGGVERYNSVTRPNEVLHFRSLGSTKIIITIELATGTMYVEDAQWDGPEFAEERIDEQGELSSGALQRINEFCHTIRRRHEPEAPECDNTPTPKAGVSLTAAPPG